MAKAIKVCLHVLIVEVPDTWLLFFEVIVASVTTTLIVAYLREGRLRSIEGRLNNRVSRESKALRRLRTEDALRKGIQTVKKGLAEKKPLQDVIITTVGEAIEENPLDVLDVVKEVADDD